MWPASDKRYWSHYLRVRYRRGSLLVQTKSYLRLFETPTWTDYVQNECTWPWSEFHSDYWNTDRGAHHLLGGSICHANNEVLRARLLQAYLTLIQRLENHTCYHPNEHPCSASHRCSVWKDRRACVNCNTPTPCQQTKNIEKLACPVDGCTAEYYIGLRFNRKWRRSPIVYHYLCVQRYQDLGAVDAWPSMIALRSNNKPQQELCAGNERTKRPEKSVRMRFHNLSCSRYVCESLKYPR